jgi:hypothetical protein
VWYVCAPYWNLSEPVSRSLAMRGATGTPRDPAAVAAAVEAAAMEVLGGLLSRLLLLLLLLQLRPTDRSSSSSKVSSRGHLVGVVGVAR